MKDHADKEGEHGAETQGAVIKSFLNFSITDFFLAVFTLALVIISARQHNRLKESIEQARDDFISNQRPRLRVRNIDIRHVGNAAVYGPLPTVKIGFPMIGQFYIENRGGTDATVVGVLLNFWADNKPLPMKRPYEGLDGTYRAHPAIILAGRSATVMFDERVQSEIFQPLEEVKLADSTLYAMGWIDYIDARYNRRRTSFCRSYDPETRRFMRPDGRDYDYESEE